MIWSEELYAIFGVAPEGHEPTYAGYLELVHPDDRSHSMATIEHAATAASRTR